MIVTQTPRLTLRYFNPNDLDALTPILADPKVMRYSISGVKTRSQTAEFINWMLSNYAKYGLGLYAAIHQQDRCLIGYCGLLVWYFEEIQEIEIGYRLATKYWGRGLATEAAVAVRNYAWEKLNLNRLISLVEPANVRSVRVIDKLGMKYEKNIVLQGLDVAVYSISK